MNKMIFIQLCFYLMPICSVGRDDETDLFFKRMMLRIHPCLAECDIETLRLKKQLDYIQYIQSDSLGRLKCQMLKLAKYYEGVNLERFDHYKTKYKYICEKRESLAEYYINFPEDLNSK